MNKNTNNIIVTFLFDGIIATTQKYENKDNAGTTRIKHVNGLFKGNGKMGISEYIAFFKNHLNYYVKTFKYNLSKSMAKMHWHFMFAQQGYCCVSVLCCLVFLQQISTQQNKDHTK